MMNTAKTKIMTNIRVERFKIGAKEIEIVEEYNYLGQMVAFEGKGKLELRARKASVEKLLNTWGGAILKGNLPMEAKIKILEPSVIPTLTYRAQTYS